MGRPANPIDPDESMGTHYGWKIRTYREEKGWSLAELAEKLACSEGHLSKLERGQKAPDSRIAKLLDATVDTDYFSEHWKIVAKERIPAPARSLAEHEGEADQIRAYHPNLITGLLQTEDYIRTIARSGATPDLEEEIVTLRLRRQSIFERARPPRFLAIMDEAALHRTIGGPEVMKRQLTRLEEAIGKPAITVQIVPARTTAYAGLSAEFIILSFADGPDIAFQDGIAGTGRIIEDGETMERLNISYDLIRSVALPADESTELIKKVREAL